ncbi:hypothetical protein [uncultured Alcanivorax sp.]|jgi:hypothetical protein|uniref:hypothetical protein n=1 Tax=Alcanivorax sp. TaxID=1872427 RepID=UPI0025D54D35|nr:hypothetical protein [uncultured Alcanivorax sp.]
MKTLSLLCLCSCLLVLTAVEVQTSTPNHVSARTTSAMPASKNIIPAMPRSPGILQSVHGTPVHFDAFQTINLNDDDDGIEFGISVKELNLHLVNQRTGNRLI